tara:strand:- start:2608 stop:3003 length:396 start_codon:yes stop_codon:yes gene_type:complete
MRLIKLSGLFFLYRALQQHSLRALIIFINGVLNHGLTTKKNYHNKNIKCIRNYDIVGNAIMTIYTFYKYPQSRIYGYFGVSNFIVIYTLFTMIERTNKNVFFGELSHVLLVQLPLFSGLEASLGLKPLLSF